MENRVLKVCKMPSGKKYAPGLNLKGVYLEKYGFEVGDFVTVSLEADKITIEKVPENNALRKFRKENKALDLLIERLNLEPANQ